MRALRGLGSARWAMVTAVLAAVVGGVVGSRIGSVERAGAQDGAVNATSVTAREFRLVDGQGKARIVMAVSNDGEVYVNLRDKDEAPLVVLSVTADGTSWIEAREKGTSRRVQMTGAGGPAFYVVDGNNTERTRLGLGGAVDVPFMRLRDANGQERLYFGQYGDMLPHIDIRNAGGEPVWQAP